MLIKAMTDRSGTTAMLSGLVEKRLRSRSRLWAAEVSFGKNTSEEVRVDYMGFNPRSVGHVVGPAGVELGTFDCYEVKSCMDDFRSGHGLNFLGDRNYLVCTRELAEQLRGDACELPVDAVLVPDAPRGKLVTMYEQYAESRRIHPASEMLWQMVTARRTGYGDKLLGGGGRDGC